MKTYTIAILPGDGIGPEVIAQASRVLDVVRERFELRTETALLALRKLLGVYANLRPVAVHPVLTSASPLKAERLKDVDLLVVRELTGGLYYGEPRGRTPDHAVNTLS